MLSGIMMDYTRQAREAAREEGREEGRKEERRKLYSTARKLHEETDWSIELIARITGLSCEEVSAALSAPAV